MARITNCSFSFDVVVTVVGFAYEFDFKETKKDVICTFEALIPKISDHDAKFKFQECLDILKLSDEKHIYLTGCRADYSYSLFDGSILGEDIVLTFTSASLKDFMDFVNLI